MPCPPFAAQPNIGSGRVKGGRSVYKQIIETAGSEPLVSSQ